MSTPYGIQITENCLICKLRHSGFFCDLPKGSLEELEKVKYASAYPQGAVLFVEGQAPRGVYIVCSGRQTVDDIARGKNADPSHRTSRRSTWTTRDSLRQALRTDRRD